MVKDGEDSKKINMDCKRRTWKNEGLIFQMHKTVTQLL